MNKVFLSGRLGRDPEVRWSQGEPATCVARFSLGVTRDIKDKDGNYGVDWINCVAFGRQGEFVEKYLKKGSGVEILGRIQTGSYTNKDGQKVYTTDVITEKVEFGKGSPKSDAGSNAGQSQNPPAPSQAAPPNMGDGFMNIPDGLDDELPFNQEEKTWVQKEAEF